MDAPPAVRMLAIDLDGTLLNDAKQFSDATAAALQSLAARDVKVVIASARPPRSVRHIYHRLALDTWQINYNGALIWDETSGLPVFHQPMEGTLVRQIIESARAMFPQVLVTCEILDRWFTDRFDQTYTTETGRIFRPDVIAPLDTFCDRPITKLLFLGEPNRLLQVGRALADAHRRHVTIVRCEDELIQIMDRRVSKAAALRQVAKHYGVHLPQIMAIGDAQNDVEMLKSAGVAIAMDNAHPSVKKVADWVAPSNNDHGVLATLQRYGLCD